MEIPLQQFEMTNVKTDFETYVCTGESKDGSTIQIGVMSTSTRDAAIAAKRELNQTYKNKSFVIIETKLGNVEKLKIEMGITDDSK